MSPRVGGHNFTRLIKSYDHAHDRNARFTMIQKQKPLRVLVVDETTDALPGLPTPKAIASSYGNRRKNETVVLPSRLKLRRWNFGQANPSLDPIAFFRRAACASVSGAAHAITTVIRIALVSQHQFDFFQSFGQTDIKRIDLIRKVKRGLGVLAPPACRFQESV